MDGVLGASDEVYWKKRGSGSKGHVWEWIE